MDGVIGPINDRLDKIQAELALHREVLAPQLAEKAKADADAAEKAQKESLAEAKKRQADHDAWVTQHEKEVDAIMQQAKAEAAEQWRADQLATAKASFVAEIAEQEKAQRSA